MPHIFQMTIFKTLC